MLPLALCPQSHQARRLSVASLTPRSRCVWTMSPDQWRYGFCLHKNDHFLLRSLRGGLAPSPCVLTARLACKGSAGTEISLSQKQQIQQLWLLQETRICTGLISPGLYHHIKSRSYYALSGGQGLTLSGVGEMIPQPPGWLRHLLPPTLTLLGSSLPCLRKAAPRQDRPCLGHPDLQTTKSLLETEQGFDPAGKAVTGTNVFGDKSPHLRSCLSFKDAPGECEQMLGRRWLSKLEKNGCPGREVLAPNLEFLCHIKNSRL